MPNAVYPFGATHREVARGNGADRARPHEVGPGEWPTREQVGDEYMSLLSKGSAMLDARAIAELEEWFGTNGRFPAVKSGNE